MGGRPPQSATFREAGKSLDFYTFIMVFLAMPSSMEFAEIERKKEK
jgi:hypothetical protein